MQRIIFWAVVVIAVLALIWVKFTYFPKENAVGAGPAKPAGAGMPPAAVTVVVASMSKNDNSLFATGSILPNEVVELRPEASGKIVSINLPEGKRIAAGTLLVKLNDADLQAQLKKIGYEENLARTNEERLRKLRDLQAIGQDEYDIASNKLLSLSAERELLVAQIAKTELRAPFDGILGFKNVALGSYITPQSTVAVLRQTNPVKIDFTLPEKFASVVKAGERINFTVDGNKTPYTANISTVDVAIDETTRSLHCRALCPNPSGNLVSGTFVKVSLSTGTGESIMVPTQAVVPTARGKQVFVARQGKATPTPIETGLRTAESIEVVSGLSVGDTIITSGLMAIKPGQPLQIKQ